MEKYAKVVSAMANRVETLGASRLSPHATQCLRKSSFFFFSGRTSVNEQCSYDTLRLIDALQSDHRWNHRINISVSRLAALVKEAKAGTDKGKVRERLLSIAEKRLRSAQLSSMNTTELIEVLTIAHLALEAPLRSFTPRVSSIIAPVVREVLDRLPSVELGFRDDNLSTLQGMTPMAHFETQHQHSVTLTYANFLSICHWLSRPVVIPPLACLRNEDAALADSCVTTLAQTIENLSLCKYLDRIIAARPLSRDEAYLIFSLAVTEELPLQRCGMRMAQTFLSPTSRKLIRRRSGSAYAELGAVGFDVVAFFTFLPRTPTTNAERNAMALSLLLEEVETAEGENTKGKHKKKVSLEPSDELVRNFPSLLSHRQKMLLHIACLGVHRLVTDRRQRTAGRGSVEATVAEEETRLLAGYRKLMDLGRAWVDPHKHADTTSDNKVALSILLGEFQLLITDMVGVLASDTLVKPEEEMQKLLHRADQLLGVVAEMDPSSRTEAARKILERHCVVLLSFMQHAFDVALSQLDAAPAGTEENLVDHVARTYVAVCKLLLFLPRNASLRIFAFLVCNNFTVLWKQQLHLRSSLPAMNQLLEQVKDVFATVIGLRSAGTTGSDPLSSSHAVTDDHATDVGNSVYDDDMDDISPSAGNGWTSYSSSSSGLPSEGAPAANASVVTTALNVLVLHDTEGLSTSKITGSSLTALLEDQMEHATERFSAGDVDFFALYNVMCMLIHSFTLISDKNERLRILRSGAKTLEVATASLRRSGTAFPAKIQGKKCEKLTAAAGGLYNLVAPFFSLSSSGRRVGEYCVELATYCLPRPDSVSQRRRSRFGTSVAPVTQEALSTLISIATAALQLVVQCAMQLPSTRTQAARHCAELCAFVSRTYTVAAAGASSSTAASAGKRDLSIESIVKMEREMVAAVDAAHSAAKLQQQMEKWTAPLPTIEMNVILQRLFYMMRSATMHKWRPSSNGRGVSPGGSGRDGKHAETTPHCVLVSLLQLAEEMLSVRTDEILPSTWHQYMDTFSVMLDTAELLDGGAPVDVRSARHIALAMQIVLRYSRHMNNNGRWAGATPVQKATPTTELPTVELDDSADETSLEASSKGEPAPAGDDLDVSSVLITPRLASRMFALHTLLEDTSDRAYLAELILEALPASPVSANGEDTTDLAVARNVLHSYRHIRLAE